MSPKRPEFADCLASPSPRTRGLAMPILGFLLCGQLTGCFLIPTVETECTIDKPCPTGQHCSDSGWCELDPGVPPPDMMPYCVSNRDCKESKVCVYDSADRSKNYCLDSNKLLYVDPLNCTNNTPDGTISRPYCNLADAINRVDDGGSIKICADQIDGIVDSSAFMGKKVNIYGPYEPNPDISPTFASLKPTLKSINPIRVWHDKTSLNLDGFVVSGAVSSKGAIECSSGGKLSVTRTLIRSSDAWGLDARDCGEVKIDRSYIVNNKGAVFLSQVGKYSISNSIISGNHPSTAESSIRVIGGKGLIQFNTIVNNKTLGLSGKEIEGAIQIENVSSPVEIFGSIVYLNSMPAGPDAAQFFPVTQFKLQGVVIGDAMQQALGPDVRRMNPIFVNYGIMDYRLSEDMASISVNQKCCIEQYQLINDNRVDLFGKERKSLTDIGAITTTKN